MYEQTPLPTPTSDELVVQVFSCGIRVGLFFGKDINHALTKAKTYIKQRPDWVNIKIECRGVELY